MRTLVLVATILTVATGCDKVKLYQTEAEQRFAEMLNKMNKRDPASLTPPRAYVDLAGKPAVLFRVSGERRDARMVPVAIVDGGRAKPLILSRRGWHQFERLYTPEGTTLPLYRGGQRAGTATVRQSMWQNGDSAAVYSLPGCRLALPAARVALEGDVAGRDSVEALASNGTFTRAREGASIAPAELRRRARDLGLLVASRLGVSPRQLDSLTLRTVAVPTGATGRPTLVISYTDPAATTADTTRGYSMRQIFILADIGNFDYGPSYWFNQRVGFPVPEFRRYVDHLDLDGDGVDEMILEASFPELGSAYAVLRYESGRWVERYRSDPDRCLDGKV